jgi:alpha-ketoglutarate-dependent taurine dioxygenase
VRVHPATGRKNLFVGRHASHIVGQDLEESRKLLADLTDQGAQPPRTYKHKWAEGDIVIWDNRCVLHRGHRWPEDQPRTMVRTTVAGDDSANEWALVEETRGPAVLQGEF